MESAITIICAISDGKRTWIGSDSRTRFGDEYFDLTEKWVQCGEWWIGCSGPGRMVHLLRAHAVDLGLGNEPWAFALALRDVLRADGWSSGKDKEGTEKHDQSCILVRPGAVWMVTQDCTPLLWPAGRMAVCGSGQEFAAGAAYAMLGGLSGSVGAGDLVVRTSIEAAIAHDVGCGGEPFVHVLLPSTCEARSAA